MLIGLDTNILVHATLIQDMDKHEKAKKFLERIVESGNYLISLQVVAEYYYVVMKAAPRLIDEARELVEILATPQNTIHYDLPIINEALRVSGGWKRYWDTLIALTYLKAGADAIATENEKDFKHLIKTINPLK